MKHKTEDDRGKGLYTKYLVIKRANDEIVHYAFVLRYEQDPFALIALEAYADACRHTYPVLAEDLFAEIARIRRKK